LAQSNVDLFDNTDSDYIILNSAGCGAHLKSYSKYREAGISGKILDLSEFLARMETKQMSNGRLLKVAYDEPCHLLHGQGVSAEPKSLLSQIPGVELVPLKEADRCCGSAGSYSITETKMSLELLERKMNAVMETGADILVTANPGCQIQLAWGVRRRGIEMEVLHLAQFLDRVFSNEPGYPTEPIAKAN
ncbi:MAG TPA: 4Fe-4S ferredoxin, partial [Candidatus Marinimicrobia bacterium]|nr:4Fe-4S ferredoxin [Candidatus Neomarinimicrobiota bacterium]